MTPEQKKKYFEKKRNFQREYRKRKYHQDKKFREKLIEQAKEYQKRTYKKKC